jgi:hypothetical protein
MRFLQRTCRCSPHHSTAGISEGAGFLSAGGLLVTVPVPIYINPTLLIIMIMEICVLRHRRMTWRCAQRPSRPREVERGRLQKALAPGSFEEGTPAQPFLVRVATLWDNSK